MAIYSRLGRKDTHRESHRFGPDRVNMRIVLLVTILPFKIMGLALAVSSEGERDYSPPVITSTSSGLGTIGGYGHDATSTDEPYENMGTGQLYSEVRSHVDQANTKGSYQDKPKLQWNYAHHGADWTSGVCKVGRMQSPVDLHVEGLTDRRPHDLKDVFESVLRSRSSPGIYDPWIRGDIVYTYRRFISSLQVLRTPKVFRLSIPADEGSVFGALFTTDKPNLYMATHIEFHSPSEHTFNGSANRRQIEMQIWHYFGDESEDSGINEMEKAQTTKIDLLINEREDEHWDTKLREYLKKNKGQKKTSRKRKLDDADMINDKKMRLKAQISGDTNQEGTIFGAPRAKGAEKDEDTTRVHLDSLHDVEKIQTSSGKEGLHPDDDTQFGGDFMHRQKSESKHTDDLMEHRHELDENDLDSDYPGKVKTKSISSVEKESEAEGDNHGESHNEGIENYFERKHKEKNQRNIAQPAANKRKINQIPQSHLKAGRKGGDTKDSEKLRKMASDRDHPLKTKESSKYGDLVEKEQFELLNMYLLDHLRNVANDANAEKAYITDKQKAKDSGTHWGRWAVLSITFMSKEIEKTKIETLKSFPSERLMREVLKAGSSVEVTRDDSYESVGELNRNRTGAKIPKAVELDTPINLSSLMMMLETKNLSYFAYDGSFTQPNCEETVRWYVAVEPLPVSTELMLQIHRMLNPTETHDLLEPLNLVNNYRELQNVNNKLHNLGKVHLVHAYPMEYFVASSFAHQAKLVEDTKVSGAKMISVACLYIIILSLTLSNL